ncbi:DUF2384 domain-containing protein [Variovorax beijingensis]|uniref:DUF2384 domain-containing protein n=1 Tax=Variovorax beijingensis TaxID=2496117 RepID=A0A3P3E433_9BURK|nr:DUF2384 domain-containing protein [Variovorax beijingensis]
MFDLAHQLCEVVNGRPILSPAKFIEMMGLDSDAFASNALVRRDTITRSPAGIQSHIRTTLQVLAAVMGSMGDDFQAGIFWYRNEPLAVFDYKTAETLVTKRRAANVVDLRFCGVSSLELIVDL